jgi:hypothetical protein
MTINVIQLVIKEGFLSYHFKKTNIKIYFKVYKIKENILL